MIKFLEPIDLKTTRHDSNFATVSTTSSTVVYSVSTSDFSAAKITILVVSGDFKTIRELLALHDEANGYITEYAVLSAPLPSALDDDVFSADVSGGNFQLSITPSTSASRSVRIDVTLL